MRIGLATIALNESRFIPLQFAQHADWPGLVKWIWVEGACATYAMANPGEVGMDGLSVDGMGHLLARACEDFPQLNHKLRYIQYGLAVNEDPAQEKRNLRNAYLAYFDQCAEPIDALIVLDADEFYTREDQQRINEIIESNPKYLAYLASQVHFWRPPSLCGPWERYRVTGGYWSVPHCRIWRYVRGMRYTRNHNTPDTITDAKAGVELRQALTMDLRGALHRQGLVCAPICYHFGFARPLERRRADTDYYVARGEGVRDNRQTYIDCRRAWETWHVGDVLPHGAAVHEWTGPVPEACRTL